MYNIIRKIHLYAGLIILLFLLMYFVSGYAMIHPQWLPDEKPVTAATTVSLASFTGPRTPEQIAAWLDRTIGLHGRVAIPPGPPPGSSVPLKFIVYHPSQTTQIELPVNSDQLTLRTTRNTFAQTLGQLHRLHLYGGGWLFNIWGVFNDLASFACILFAFTGVYLWWKTTRQKIWGILCLAASCSYALGMILYLLYSK